MSTYNKTFWEQHLVDRPNTFEFTDNGDGSNTLVPSFGNVIQTGTPVSTINLNNVEDGIGSAHIQLDDDGNDASIVTGSIIEQLNKLNAPPLLLGKNTTALPVGGDINFNVPLSEDVSNFRKLVFKFGASSMHENTETVIVITELALSDEDLSFISMGGGSGSMMGQTLGHFSAPNNFKFHRTVGWNNNSSGGSASDSAIPKWFEIYGIERV